MWRGVAVCLDLGGEQKPREWGMEEEEAERIRNDEVYKYLEQWAETLTAGRSRPDCSLWLGKK